MAVYSSSELWSGVPAASIIGRTMSGKRQRSLAASAGLEAPMLRRPCALSLLSRANVLNPSTVCKEDMMPRRRPPSVRLWLYTVVVSVGMCTWFAVAVGAPVTKVGRAQTGPHARLSAFVTAADALIQESVGLRTDRKSTL